MGVGAPSLAALERGRVSAAVADLVTISWLKRRYPNLILLADTSTQEGMRRIFGSETSYQYTLCASPEWLRRNRDAARRIAPAIVRTLQWIPSHSPAHCGGSSPHAS